ncbi:MAG: DNA double-strand break repair nuclease NurA [Actinomycetota bacterium]|nr:DNA double-strand break repair nuclease NurA [Actinomycetota bacterium]
MAPATLSAVADRLAALLTAGGGGVRDPEGSDLVFEPDIRLRPLLGSHAPPEVWAVDGGQALVADARCLQLLVTRASRVRFVGGTCVLEDEGELRPALVGGGEERAVAASLGLGISPDATVDVNLLREHGEWDAVARCVEEAGPGAVVLVDGDLQPDWRIPASFLARLLGRAAERGVVLAGVTKRTALARGGAPLLGQLELEAESAFGPRGLWWAPVAHSPTVAVVAARLDPDARFAFRIDLPLGVDAEATLGAMAALCDDAAFPGYPYPLTVADRLAACPSWLRAETWMEVDDHLDRADVPLEVRQRAFADRHDLMERY